MVVDAVGPRRFHLLWGQGLVWRMRLEVFAPEDVGSRTKLGVKYNRW